MNITDNESKIALVKRLVEAKHISFDEALLLLGDGDTIKQSITLPYVYPNPIWWTPTIFPSRNPLEVTCMDQNTNALTLNGIPVGAGQGKVVYMNADT